MDKGTNIYSRKVIANGAKGVDALRELTLYRLYPEKKEQFSQGNHSLKIKDSNVRRINHGGR